MLFLKDLLMNLSKIFYLNHLKLFIIVGFLLFFKTSVFAESHFDVLQQANDLLFKAARTFDENLAYQAKDKLSTWLQNNKDHSDKKLVAKVLRSRADAYTMLDEKNKAISDYQESIQYDPVAPIQLLICDLKEKQGNLSASFDLRRCYSKAVTLFEKNKTPKKNINFLLARIFSGDKTAIIDYKNFYRASTGREKKICEMYAQGFFDKATYEEIVK